MRIPEKQRLRRTMMFLNAQRASLIKDAYVYHPDSIIFDLEDAVAVNQKDSARIAVYNSLKYADYKGVERFVRINGTDSPYWMEDIRAVVAGGCDGIRIPMCEYADDVHKVEDSVTKAERAFGVPEGTTLLMAAIETPIGVFNALELAKSSQRIMGISIGAGDYMRVMHARRTPSGEEMFAARAHLVMAARAANVMCFDTVHTDIYDMEGLERDTILIRNMGFDGKSVINPRQIDVIHKVFAPSKREIERAERIVKSLEEHAREGIGVFSLDGQMVDAAMLEGAKRTITLAKASGLMMEGKEC